MVAREPLSGLGEVLAPVLHAAPRAVHRATDEAARDGAPLYVAYLDFENAFNSVDHEAV